MKKLIILILALLLLFTLCSCDDEVPQFTGVKPLPQLTKETPIVTQLTFDGIDGYIECTVSYHDETKVRVDYTNYTNLNFAYDGDGILYKENKFGKVKYVKPEYDLSEGRDYIDAGLAYALAPESSTFESGQCAYAPNWPDVYYTILEPGNYIIEPAYVGFYNADGGLQRHYATIEFSI